MCFPIATMALLQRLYSTTPLMERTKTTSFRIKITLRTPAALPWPRTPRHWSNPIDAHSPPMPRAPYEAHKIWYIHLTASFTSHWKSWTQLLRVLISGTEFCALHRSFRKSLAKRVPEFRISCPMYLASFEVCESTRNEVSWDKQGLQIVSKALNRNG